MSSVQFINAHFSYVLVFTVVDIPFRTAKKNIVQFSPKFYQFFIDVHGVQIRWNFCEIFFRFEDRAFYLVFDFFNSA